MAAFNLMGAAGADDLAIRHQPPACLLADAFPRLQARLEPMDSAAKVRLFFRPESATVWHGVAAQPVEGGYAALLPRPRATARTIRYRFEATRADASALTSPEYAVTVVADAAACPGAVAESVASASVLVDVPPGAPLVPPVPAGFDPVGAVSSAPHKGTGRKKVGLLVGVVAGGGAVAGGVLAASSEPATTTLQTPPRFLVRSVTPPSSGTVSIAANNFSADVEVVIPRALSAGEAWVVFYGASNPPERPCAVVAGSYPALEPGQVARFTIRSPFIHAVPCGASFGARITFRGTTGQTLYESGLSNEVGAAGLLDAAVAYTFVP